MSAPSGTLRAAARIAGFILAVLVAVPLHGLWRLFRLPSPWPRLFLGAIGRIAGARRISIGRPLRRDVFFVANHQSWLDIPLLAGASGTAFIAKDNLEGVPLIGWLCGLNNTVFVSRTDRMGIADQIAKVRAALAEGWSLAIFPEGTTTDGRTLLPFKAPLLAVLDPPPPGVMVQPVWIDYGPNATEIAWVGDEHGKDNALRILARPGGFPVRLHFLEPFDPAAFPGRKAIAAEARRRIERAMGMVPPGE
ncbi:1-acyl-sn-glycerol-3-phosphate acyltransferase [Sphingomonas gilva]|uniref:1-acyl-sn-glycerol-3-phosphate acyltransferase n=1 Tax=Sphingomonas gilva TaxID=2305907 RepID=A0A396RX39_9SPHN|nr:lysophospholipid acyltransferase family protein [Sphingomonas gilva]RHW18281.1 1-acyl-sn-glycerol-3-phosphate acyltransferase [Sphingomonas gilva]